jgi:hypothetical protein
MYAGIFLFFRFFEPMEIDGRKLNHIHSA